MKSNNSEIIIYQSADGKVVVGKFAITTPHLETLKDIQKRLKAGGGEV